METNEKKRARATSAGEAGAAQVGESDHATSRGQKVNKTQEIRRVAKEMAAASGERPRPIEIVAKLKEQGVPVTSSQVSTALTRTEWALRPRRGSWAGLAGESPSLASVITTQVTYDDLLAARAFVTKLGNIEKCISALHALKELQAGQAANGDSGAAEQISDCRWPDRQAASRRLDEST